MDEMTLTLNSPITEEQWNAITDIDFEHTNEITFHTKHGKEVKFVKASAQADVPDINVGDMISRQAAIDAVESAKTARTPDGEIYVAKLNEEMNIQILPSAQTDLNGTKFDIIFSQRQTGRTTKLIEKCARYKYALIVCPTRMRANIVFKDARKMGKNIPMPITFEEFISGRFSTEHINAFLIDDLDQCLAIYSRNVPIDTVVFEKRMEGLSMREEEIDG